MTQPLKNSLKMGAICCPAGLLMGVYLRHTATGDYAGFPYYSTIAAFLAPTLAWWVLVERRARRAPKDGVLAGLVGAVLAHQLTWYGNLLTSNVQYWLLGMQVTSLDSAPMDPFFGFFAVLLYTGLSLVFFGWLTLPYGMVAGYLLARKLSIEGGTTTRLR